MAHGRHAKIKWVEGADSPFYPPGQDTLIRLPVGRYFC